MHTFKPQERIVVSQQQLHLNSSVITEGEIISVQGSTATVLLEGEVAARELPLATIAPASSLLGDITSRPGELPVIDMTPRR